MKRTLIVLLCSISTLPFVVDLVSRVGTDYGIYFSDGWFITKGLVIYRDFWTHKTPMLPFLLSAWISIWGSGFLSALSFAWASYLLMIIVILVLGPAVGLDRRACAIAAALYVLYVAFHQIDPTRNGIILVWASLFEFGAYGCAVWGLSHADRKAEFVLAGALLALGFFTRQTAGLSALGIFALVLLSASPLRWRQAIAQLALVAMGALIVVSIFGSYILVNSISFSSVWEQVIGFNLVYAQGYKAPLSDWVLAWADVLLRFGLPVLLLGVLFFVIRQCRIVLRRHRPSILELGLFLWFLCDLAGLYIASKVAPFYLVEIVLPAALLAGYELHLALSGDRHGQLPKSVRLLLLSALVLLIAIPVKNEAARIVSSLKLLSQARPLHDLSSRPDYDLAQEVRKFAPSQDDRILLFSATGEEVYPFSGRLPAIYYDNLARLIYVLTPNDYSEWQEMFDRNPPKVVVCPSVPDLSLVAQQSTHGRDYSNVARMYLYIVHKMELAEITKHGVALYVRP